MEHRQKYVAGKVPEGTKLDMLTVAQSMPDYEKDEKLLQWYLKDMRCYWEGMEGIVMVDGFQFAG